MFVKPFIMGGLMISLTVIGYGYQQISRGPQAFEDAVRPELNYPIRIDDVATITYAAVDGYNLLFNIDITAPYREEEAYRFHNALFGSFKDTRYCQPVKMMSYNEVVAITRIHYVQEDKEILLRDDLFYLCGVKIINRKQL